MTTKEYEFPADKNQWLKEHRGISFEEVIAAIENEGLIDILPHANPAKYPNQKIYLVNINEYVYLVPFVRKSEMCVFLKTIFKSRKMTKQYLKEKGRPV